MLEKINEKLLNMTQTVGQTVDQSVAYQKKHDELLNMTFKKSNIYTKVRVFNKVYGKEIVDKKA